MSNSAVQTSCHLTSNEALDLLRQALEQTEKEISISSLSPKLVSSVIHYPTAKLDVSSSDENDANDRDIDQSNSSSSSDDEDDDENNHNQVDRNVETDLPSITSNSQEVRPTKPRKAPVKHNPTKLDPLIKQLGRPPCLSFPLGPDPPLMLDVPLSILSKNERRQFVEDKVAICRALLQTADSVHQRPVVVLLLRSGRFAGGVFLGQKCLVHRACQRYTVRRGQGKAQSSQDNSKRKAKSMGAQLRRAGEQNLREDISSTVKEWQEHYLSEASLIFLSCPKTMRKNLFLDLSEWIARDDVRLRDVPLDVGRPSFESVCAVHEVMLTLVVREAQQQQDVVETETEQIVAYGVSYGSQTSDEIQKKHTEAPKEEDIIPLFPLHCAAQNGDFMSILQLLDTASSQEIADQVNRRAGIDFMTPLHYATESSSHVDPSTAAACVSALLIQGHADPCLVDGRNRPPYFLATHDKVRDAFRIARARLGEDYCLWDEDAKVGPALTAEGIEARKEKEAEKRRKKKTKQKEKKEKDKAQQEELELRRQEEEELRKKEEEAKRIRDGLQPKTSSAGNVCDFCQKVCKGKARHQMFKRLDYAYCTTECVEKHKRELMAAAAMARLGQATRSVEN